MGSIADNSILLRVVWAGVAIFSALVLARSLRWLIRRAGRTEWLSTLMSRSGFLAGWVDPSAQSIRTLAGNSVYWLTLFAGVAIALGTLNQQMADRLTELGWVHLPKGLLALVVLASGKWLADFGSRSVLISAANEGLRFPWRWAAAARAGLLLTSIAMASELTGVATLLIRSAYLIVLTGCALLAVLVLAPVLKEHFTSHFSESLPDSQDQIR